jgi:acetylornithine deacetylase/succinyl-diaminopimelate desuccinylase-like protein
MEGVYQFIDGHSQAFLENLREFVRQPGISTENTGIDETVGWLVSKMREKGMEDVRTFQTKRHPIVFGRIRGTSGRTLLVYGHYDVQPPGDREQWKADPFSAQIVGDQVIGRGTCDMKNNLMASLDAAEAIIQSTGSIPLNLTFLFEGEEEIGSPNLKPFIEEHKVELSDCDSILCGEGGENKKGQALLMCGYKGILYVELSVRSPTGMDVHSSYAGMIENPAWILVRALNSLKEGEKVLIPHFYDGVEEPSLGEKIKYGLARIAMSRGELEEAFDLKIKEGMSVSEALMEAFYRPTLNIDGVWSGYTVPGGTKTIVPGSASAKLDMRLVPGQNPSAIFESLERHLQSKGFGGVAAEKLGELPAYRVDPDETIARVVDQALKKTVSPKVMTIPIAPGSGAMVWLPRILGRPMISAGSGAAYMAHRPNEFITAEQYIKGVKLFATIYHDFSLHTA